MSTSDPQVATASDESIVIGERAPAGLPDTQVLARLANEFFTALPGSQPTPPAQAPAIPGAVAPNAVAPMVPRGTATPPNVPIRTELPANPAPSSAGLGTVPPVSGPNPPVTIPAFPGAIGSIDPFAVSGFSFLQEARPLYPQESGGPVAIPAPPAVAPVYPQPASEGAASPTNGRAAPSTEAAPFSFLEDLRAPSSVNTVPRVEPTGTEAVPDLKLRRDAFDVYAIRRDFPILQERVHGRRLIWLDNAATTQKPQSVIDRISYFYEHENSNIHRAAHTLAARATDAYEAARDKVRRFLNAPSTREIVFVRGTTEAINLVAQSWGRRHVEKDDEIVITWLEHHSNIVPWQLLCSEKGARLRVAPIDDDGQVVLDEYEKLFSSKTKLVSIAHVSNALGTITPVRAMVEIAHRYGARVLVDGAQAVSHMPVDVQALDADFYVFSGHKVFAPTGIGVLYGKPDALEESPPWQGGGNMIVDVTFEKTVYQVPPARFEAGTGNIADAVGLGAAIAYLEQIGMENIERYEHELLEYATQQLRTVPGLRLIGTAPDKAGVLSFVLDGYRSEDVGAALDKEGIAVRAGHHCAQPALRRFGLETSVRPSLALYNSFDDIDALVTALQRLQSKELRS